MGFQVAKATLSDANVMLDNTSGTDQMNGRHGEASEDPVRERFKAAAAVSPRFLLLDFRYELWSPCTLHIDFSSYLVRIMLLPLLAHACV